jgi:trk system potassium uptake protein TrkH
LLSFDPINGQTINDVTHGFFSNFSAALACISNIGPGFEAVGPYSSYAGYSAFSKILLSFLMLIGRLEILPVFVLFNPRTWKRS